MAGIEISKYRKKPAQKNRQKSVGGNKNIFAFLNKDISVFGNQLSDKKKERFYSELHIMFSSGVDIKTALELIENEQSKKKDKALFKEVKEKIISGSSLSSAIEATGKFSAYEYFSLQIGEETGKLPEVLRQLTSFYNDKIKQKRQILNALSYPAIVLITAFGAIFFMLKFMVPMFADVFMRFGGELPAITQFIIDISDFVSDYLLIFFLFLTGVVVALYMQRKKEWLRSISSKIVLKLPVAGNLVRKIYLARFCQSMSLLIGARIPIIRSIELVKQMINFYPIETSLSDVQEDVMRGKSLYSSLGAFPIYNQRLISLIRVGEEVNQLDNIFDKLEKQYTQEVEHQTGLIGSLIEPIMIIFLGLIVAIILIAMYLPLFQVSAGLGG